MSESDTSKHLSETPFFKKLGLPDKMRPVMRTDVRDGDVVYLLGSTRDGKEQVVKSYGPHTVVRTYTGYVRLRNAQGVEFNVDEEELLKTTTKTIPVYLETKAMFFIGYAEVDDLTEFPERAEEVWRAAGYINPFLNTPGEPLSFGKPKLKLLDNDTQSA